MEFTPTAEHPALATVAGDQCSACGAPLAPDQRYCVQCGQRRGQSRLPATPAPVNRATTARARRVPQWGVNSTLIAGVGTLLLAMGVGVLIGHSSRPSEPVRAASPVQVVTVGSGGAASTGGATASGAKSAKTVKSTGKAASSADVAKAAKKIKGTNLTLPKKAVVKVGSPGTGPGYDKKTHKFTGNFFGG
jgi:hypothetical protein